MTKKDTIIALYNKGLSIETIMDVTESKRHYVRVTINRTDKYIKEFGYSKGLQKRATRL